MAFRESMDNKRQGIILKGVGGFYEVMDRAAGLVYTCKARGVHRKAGGKSPLPGDNVTFRVIDEKDRTGFIDRIGERKNICQAACGQYRPARNCSGC